MIEIKRSKEASYEMLEITGEIDASSSIELDSAISAAISEEINALLVDCTALQYISSAGLGVFMSYIEDLKQKNITLVLFGLSDKVANVFEIVGLDQLLNIHANREAAIAQLG